MHQHSLLAFLLLISSSLALPLNINLGAYSPALVVGDGEISFGGKQDVSALMTALQGAAVNNAAANGAPAPAPAPAPEAAAVVAAAVANPDTPPTIVEENIPTAPVLSAADVGTQMTALQGLGKEIAPRIVTMEKSEKRDLAGFNAALKFASDALKTSPGVELGTGEGGSGVGIKQAPGNAAPAAAPAAAAKRDETLVKPKVKTTVTTMLVRGGPVPASARSVESLVEKRAPSSPSTIDGVNLNMAEGQLAELTFVETREVGEEEAIDDEEEDEDEE